MNRFNELLFIILCSFSTTAQQVIPADGSVLTRTSILLEVPEVIGAISYEFKVLAIDGSETMVFTEPNQAAIVDGLSFGKGYQWTVIASDEKQDTLKAFTSYFNIAYSPLIDPNLNRFNTIRQSSGSGLKGILFLDYSRVAITPDGVPVWYMPNRKELENKRLRDLKQTNKGTLTYLDVSKCEEINLDGSTLWVRPSNDSFSDNSIDYFHHEFTRLSNGNYMVLGKSFVKSDLVIDGKQITTIPLSIIIEFNYKGEIVWTWSSDKYITNDDILQVGKKVALGNTFGHMNSFFFDEPSGIVYAGFRDLNCILAIEKHSGEILQSYGDKIPSDTTQQAVGFFSKQHAPIKLSEDRLLLFNNNDRKKTSSVQIISEVTKNNPNSKLEWEFKCDFDSLMPPDSPRMGNALLLDNDNVLVNMGAVARLFEVSPNKEVLWQCFPEQRNDTSQSWVPKPNYRIFNASSLYPFHFTVMFQNHDSIPSLRIDNEGSENDRYEITIFKRKNKKHIIKRVYTEIDAKNSTILYLKNHFKKGKLPKSICVEIQSINNPSQILSRYYKSL